MPSDNDRDSHAAMYILHQGSIGLMRRGRVQPQRVKMTRNHQIRPGIRNTTRSIFPRQDRPFPLLAWLNASVMHRSDHASRTLNVSSHAFANHFIAKKLLLPTLSPCEKDHHSQARKRAGLSRGRNIKISSIDPTARRRQMGSVWCSSTNGPFKLVAD